MASDYAAIRDENRRRYGTDIGRIGPMLLADRYDDRTHFIFELLQNAEDALGRRVHWEGSRAVGFALAKGTLRVSHFGKPFDDRDVRGICGIAQSTKDLTEIGRFGIGFKSVYALTDRPEVHSGAEDFAIENFVWPIAAPEVSRDHEETTIVLPLNEGDDAAHEEIAGGLRRLGPSTLLFLRYVEEIAWSVKAGTSGLYMRSKPEEMGENIRRISVLGQEEGEPDLEETWLIFSREAKSDDGVLAGNVEIAFSVGQEKESDRWSVQAIGDSPLVVFFPTVISTHLGFLVQGPYRTTPSRDNVPRTDPWNRHLVKGTATLLVEALRWLRDHDMLNTVALASLPLDPTRFGEGSMFRPLFQATKQALKSEPLLPRFGGGYVPATNAKLARTQQLRQLLHRSQLGSLFPGEEPAWLSGDITQDRTPELREYLMLELDIGEATPETILSKLDRSFLETQLDDWIRDLYEFLNGQPGLRRRLEGLPLIRLEDGAHVPVRSNGRPEAFLPSGVETGFPTVRPAVCATEGARKFLLSVGLTEPDPVDDVVRNILPRYCGEDVNLDIAEYEADIRRILSAFGTDSKTRREKLVAALRHSFFVMVTNAGDQSKRMSRPGEAYFATERFKKLFAGVSGVQLVDDSHGCLRGESARDLLEACGTTRHLRPLPAEVPWKKRRQLRERAETTGTRSEEHIQDHTIHGLEGLLGSLQALEPSEGLQRSELLWEALGDLEQRQRKVFTGTYRGQYYGPRRCDFDPAFVELLNNTAWVPDGRSQLQQPEFVTFDTLGWKANPFLLTKIRFKPPIIETLAKEAGIDPGVLDLLKKHGMTSVDDLKARLGIHDEGESAGMSGIPRSADPSSRGSGGEASSPGGGGTDGRATGEVKRGGDQLGGQGEAGASRGPTGSIGSRPFISYVATHADRETDPDGLDQQARLSLEEKAIALIISEEPELQRTAANNPGYDLWEPSDDGRPHRYIEVKAMSQGLRDRPVGVSHTQFECARAHREAYWLYVVEYADDDETARVVRIQDPAGKARTFTFDHGWLEVAAIRGRDE